MGSAYAKGNIRKGGEQVGKKHKRQIEQIIAGMECKKDFECYKSGFEKLCKAKDEGLKDYIWCLDKTGKSQSCGFKLPFGSGALCKCPLRVYIAKKLNK
jgi:hypothetical protein